MQKVARHAGRTSCAAGNMRYRTCEAGMRARKKACHAVQEASFMKRARAALSGPGGTTGIGEEIVRRRVVEKCRVTGVAESRQACAARRRRLHAAVVSNTRVRQRCAYCAMLRYVVHAPATPRPAVACASVIGVVTPRQVTHAMGKRGTAVRYMPSRLPSAPCPKCHTPQPVRR